MGHGGHYVAHGGLRKERRWFEPGLQPGQAKGVPYACSSDLDLRRPQVANLLGLKNPPSMENFLKGQSGLESTFVRYGDNVAIAANQSAGTVSSELLQSQMLLRP